MQINKTERIKKINQLLRAYYYHSYVAQKQDNNVKKFPFAFVDIFLDESEQIGISMLCSRYESMRTTTCRYGTPIYNRHQFYKGCFDRLMTGLDIENIQDYLEKPNDKYLELLLQNNESLLTKITNKVKKIQRH